MKINSGGIYTNRGYLQNQNLNVPDSKKPEIKKSNENKATNSPNVFKNKTLNDTRMLSSAETSEISRLFGKFDLEALASGKLNLNDNRPGQIIDIEV